MFLNRSPSSCQTFMTSVKTLPSDRAAHKSEFVLARLQRAQRDVKDLPCDNVSEPLPVVLPDVHDEREDVAVRSGGAQVGIRTSPPPTCPAGRKRPSV